MTLHINMQQDTSVIEFREWLARNSELNLEDIGNFLVFFDMRHKGCGKIHQIAVCLCTNNDIETVSLIMRGTEATIEYMEEEGPCLT